MHLLEYGTDFFIISAFRCRIPQKKYFYIIMCAIVQFIVHIYEIQSSAFRCGTFEFRQNSATLHLLLYFYGIPRSAFCCGTLKFRRYSANLHIQFYIYEFRVPRSAAELKQPLSNFQPEMKMEFLVKVCTF